MYERDLLVDVEADVGGVHGGAVVSPEAEPVGIERRLDLDALIGGEDLQCGMYAADLRCEHEGGDVTPRSQYEPSLAQHESPRGGDEFVGSPSVSARVEAQGCDTSDEEPPDGLGGQYTWGWLDDAEAFVVGGDLQ